MSRTYKDKHWKLRFPEGEYHFGHERIAYETYYREWDVTLGKYIETSDLVTRYVFVEKAGVKTKKKRKDDTEWHWMSTPSWWTRLTMNRPQRRKGRQWERKVHFQDLEETDPPGVSKKPHVYYW